MDTYTHTYIIHVHYIAMTLHLTNIKKKVTPHHRITQNAQNHELKSLTPSKIYHESNLPDIVEILKT